MIFATGLTPSSWALSALITTSADAPSFIADAFAAVTVPSFLNAGFSFAIDSAVMPSRIVSSVVNAIGSALRCGTMTSNFSASKRPAAVASAARRWLSAANSSCAARVMSCFSAAISPVMPMWQSL